LPRGSFKLITIVFIVQHGAIGIDRRILPHAVAEDTGKERVNTALIVGADGQFM
jgi:hypothetical protein